MIFIQGEVSTHISLETGDTAWYTGRMEWHQVQSEGGGSEANRGRRSLYCGFHKKEWTNRGKQVYDWLI